MDTHPISGPGDLSPGSRVKVIEGTFVGQRGEILSIAEAWALWKKAGGEPPPLKVPPGIICVTLRIFERRVPVWLETSQVQVIAPEPD